MFRPEQKLSLKYLPSLRMQQGLHMLQFPITELSSYLLQQIIHNPCFDLSSLEEEEWSPCLSLPSIEVSQPESLLSYLYTQIQHTFDNPQDVRIAQHIIGNLSEQGLLSIPIQELALQLEVPVEEIAQIQIKIQHFHPLGIASSSLQDYWLFLLKHSSHTLAYTLIKDHYNALRNCDFSSIAKKLRCSPNHLLKSLKDALTSIPWSPAAGYTSPRSCPQPSLPDIYLKYEVGIWEIHINSRGLPPIRIDSHVLHIYEQLPEQEKKNLKHQILSAKWLIKNLKKREQLLFAIVEKMLPYQESFLLGKSSAPQALSVKFLAEELPYHQSTLFRAIENKTIATPKGIFPLKYLFPRPIHNSTQSKETILRWIHQWISSETSPLSDADISKRISEQGIPCARRTVAKYRAQLNILPAHKRHRYVKRFYSKT
ncbi:RNA polymerase factor sigma-54 [Chlamydia avium]|uniref:RNA polymerase sigma-54 factor n=1 Tax=Chlamydia avium 10DC88 TaxID=1229831 RepID=W8K185_9CHLA|nr:RNA polymerase factor sigma-54 [Chlamydia avium]AHK63622.1 RNA polymerase sigma-54 factor [Chlamydia avium 10DC88]